jgi:hypothetical protein
MMARLIELAPALLPPLVHKAGDPLDGVGGHFF